MSYNGLSSSEIGFRTAPASAPPTSGAGSGATKSFGREYPDSCVRTLDLHPDLKPTDKAGFIVRSLKEGFPLETGVGADGRLAAIRLARTGC